jgi:signal peptidase
MFRRIAWGVLTVVALVAVGGWAYMAFVSPHKVYIVYTGSMEPTIPVKSAELVRVGHYQVGEVVTFRVHGETVTHRLLSIKPDGTIVTKGDANRTIDPWQVNKRDIVGGVVAAPRMVGWWLIYFRQPSTVIAIVAYVLAARLLYGWDSESEPSGRHVPRHSSRVAA